MKYIQKGLAPWKTSELREMKSLMLKTNILFGMGVIEKLQLNCRQYGNKFIMISTSKTLQRNGIIDNIIERFKKENLDIILTTGASSDPKSNEINAIFSSHKQNQYDAVIGIGGGSSIDAAKAVAVLMGEKQDDIETYMNSERVPQKVLPIIAVPTTSGTGSEVSAGAIITRTDDDLKMGIRGELLIPKLALLDPILTASCPKKLTRDAGFDILSHGFESFVSKKSNPISEEISLNVIDLVICNLPKVLDNPKDLVLRSKLMYASFMAGINLLNVGTCLPHRIQYTVGIPLKVTHGEGLSIIYRSWLKHLSSVNKLDMLGKIFHCEEKPEDVIICMQKFMDEIGFHRHYKGTGKLPEIEKFKQRLHGNLKNDPIYSQKMVEIIYSELLQGNNM